MSSDYDAAEFIDGDFEGRPSPHSVGAAAQGPRAPTRDEVDSRVTETQQKLAELRRAQEQLERERVALEETRRRQAEFQTGRQEMLQNLTRGVDLLQEAEFASRRDAEQMSKSLVDLREALTRLQTIKEETWTQENFSVELTRALTAIENARMEWNTARLKFEVLSMPSAEAQKPALDPDAAQVPTLLNCSFVKLCKLGFALSWPVAAVLLLGVLILLGLQLRR
jgi:DNA repair exonuclease SbcCD ATPase subunit